MIYGNWRGIKHFSRRLDDNLVSSSLYRMTKDEEGTERDDRVNERNFETIMRFLSLIESVGCIMVDMKMTFLGSKLGSLTLT